MIVKNPPHDYRTGIQLRGLVDLILDLPKRLRDFPMLEGQKDIAPLSPVIVY